MKNVDLMTQDDCPSFLVVSHGGLIRRLFVIFFEEMNCKFPASITTEEQRQVLASLLAAHTKFANTSWSQVEFGIKNDVIENMRCNVLFNSDHLNSLN